MTKLHTLVDLENVHPTIEDLRKLVPRMTDAWVFPGPNQAREAALLKAAHDGITLVPHSGKGKYSAADEMGMVVRQLQRSGIVTIAGDQVTYWRAEGGAAA